jgi:hypothetical protein
MTGCVLALASGWHAGGSHHAQVRLRQLQVGLLNAVSSVDFQRCLLRFWSIMKGCVSSWLADGTLVAVIMPKYDSPNYRWA